MKLERNTERKYSMQVMSTTTTITTATTTKWKFRFTRGFMLVLELKGFYSGAKNTHSAIPKSLTFAGLSNLASH